MLLALDTNRLIKPTQRRISAAWLESTGDTLTVLPQVAHELTHGKYNTDLELALKQSYETLDAVYMRGDTHIGFIVECDIWWIKELLDKDSMYTIAELNREEYERSIDIRKSFPVEAFPSRSREDLTNDSDAIIISQALLKNQNLLITSDSNTLKPGVFNEWLLRKGNEHGVSSDPVLFVQDDVLKDLFEGNEHELLCIVIGAAWPRDIDARSNEVISNFEGQLSAMKAGALLPKIAAMIEREWSQVKNESRVLAFVKEHYIPHKTRQSEHRHPAVEQISRKFNSSSR